jgi:hypothetical protein
MMVTYARPDSHPVLLTANETFDAATAVRFGLLLADGALIVASPEQRYVYTQNVGVSSSTFHRYELRYGALAAVPLSATRLATNNGGAWGNGADLAVSADGTVVYVAAGYPYQFDRLAADTLTPLSPPLAGTPYPVNVETCWNGRVGAGADASNEPGGDLWIYDVAGTELARLDSGNDALFRQTLRLSGDCTRMLSGSGSGLRIHAVP